MNKSFLITSLILLISLTSIRAERAETGSLISRIKARAAEVDTFICDFRQEKHLKIFKNPVVFKGRLLVDRPDKLRWEFTSPIPSVLILNKNKGLKCSPEGERQEFNLGSDPTMSLLAEQLWSWLSGDYSKLQDKFNLTEQHSPPVLTITPKTENSDRMFKEISIRLAPGLLHPTSITIRTTGEDRTLLYFKDYKLNRSLADSLFLNCGDRAQENDSG